MIFVQLFINIITISNYLIRYCDDQKNLKIKVKI